MIIQLVFSFDTASWEGLFDRLEVWRSRGTADGPYEPLHDVSWMPARLPPNTPGSPPSPPQTGPSAVLVGKTLKFLIDEMVPVSVTFTGTDPLNYGQAATQIQAQSNGLLTAFVLGSALIVQTVEPGIKAILRCVGGDPAPLLGLATTEPSSLAYGRDARIVLKQGEQNYGFTDPHGDTSYFYKARFVNSFTGATNDYSLPVQGIIQSGLDISNLVRCYIDVVDMTGNAVVGQELLVYNAFNGQQVQGKVITGGSVTKLTDSQGHAEVFLARGLLVSVSVGGTPLARQVTIPADPAIESLNLLAAASGNDDLFTVQVPVIPFAVRRTL